MCRLSTEQKKPVLDPHLIDHPMYALVDAHDRLVLTAAWRIRRKTAKMIELEKDYEVLLAYPSVSLLREENFPLYSLGRCIYTASSIVGFPSRSRDKQYTRVGNNSHLKVFPEMTMQTRSTHITLFHIFFAPCMFLVIAASPCLPTRRTPRLLVTMIANEKKRVNRITYEPEELDHKYMS